MKWKTAILCIIIVVGFTVETTIQSSSIISSTNHPDLIILDANVITMESDGEIYSSIVIKDGVISDVSNSSHSNYLSNKNVNKIQLAGKSILPGFIDSHSHWIGDREVIPLNVDETIASALSHGWTSISEQFVNEDRLQELIYLDEQDRLKLRVNAYLPINYQEQRFGDWYQAYTPHLEFGEKVRIAGVKLFMDNGESWTDRTHWFTPEELNPIVKTAHDLGYQISIHSIADTGTDMALNALQAAQGDNSEGVFRHKIEHASFLRDDQLQRLLEMNVTVSAQLLWYTSDWAEGLETDLTEADADKMYPWFARWSDLLETGIRLIGSTDTPWGIPDRIGSSIRALYASTTRIGYDNLPPPQYMLDQRLTIDQALKAITIDAAYSTFQEDEKGSIKIDKLADFVVLSENPYEVDPENLLDLEVEMTIVGGEVMYCKPGLEEMCAGSNQVVEISRSIIAGESSSREESFTTDQSSSTISSTTPHFEFLSVFMILVSTRLIKKNIGRWDRSMC